MARTPAQSDFVVYPAPPATPDTAATAATADTPAAPGEPPPDGALASDGATRWVMRATWFMLLVLVLLCVIGPHIPSGE